MKYGLMTLFLLVLTAMTQKTTAIEFTYTENDTSGNNLALGYPVPLPVDSITPVDGFRNYNSLHLRHQQLSAQATWLSPLVLGDTFNGREIYGYQISTDNNLTTGGATKGTALINGGIHAREWQSPEAVTGYMEKLFEQQNNQHIEQYLIENINLMLIPVLNIDGYLQTQRYPTTVTSSAQSPRDGRMRRKNMRDADENLATLTDNLRGIDLNRNNNPYWATNSARSSSDVSSIVHHGSGAASEPETQALQNAALQIGESRLRFYTDTHSFSQIYFTPLTGDQRRDQITGRLASIMRSANDYKYLYGPSASGGGIGATDEYFANTYQIPSYTLEIEPLNSGTDYGGFGVSHDGFIMPASEVSRMREETSKATFAGLYAMAEIPYVQEVIIKQANEIVFHILWQNENSIRELSTAVSNELLANVDYQLTLIFNKPMRQLSDGQVSDFSNKSSANGMTLNWLLKTADNSDSISIDASAGSWLTQDFKRYKTDSYQVNFSFPESFSWNDATRLALSVDTVDMTGQSLDTNPATIADWLSGHWANYENSAGETVDLGGIDKSMRLIDDGSDLYADEDDGGSTPTTPTTPTTPSTPTAESSGSSGGSWHWSVVVFISLLLSYRLARQLKQIAR